MSSLTTAPMDPKELRPLLHAEVDRLRDENLLVLHRVALELELDEVTERLNEGFDADRAAGKLARLPEIIREPRAALRTRQAPGSSCWIPQLSVYPLSPRCSFVPDHQEVSRICLFLTDSEN